MESAAAATSEALPAAKAKHVAKKMAKPKNVTRAKKPPTRSSKADEAKNQTKPKPRPLPVSTNQKIQDQRVERERANLNKKIEGQQGTIEELRSKFDAVSKECQVLRQQKSLKELEADKLTQFWTIAKNQLEEEIRRGVEVEERTARMKTAHLEEVSLLKKRIRYLRINAVVQFAASTQTDADGSGPGGVCSRAVQTQEVLTRRKANEKLRLNDNRLAELMVELEKERQQALSDHKFAVVQVETRLKVERANEVRRLKEEKLSEVEEVTRSHFAQLFAMEEEYNKAKSALTEQNSQLKMEVSKLRHELEQNTQLREELDLQLTRSKESAIAFECANTKMQTELYELQTNMTAIKRDERRTVVLQKQVTRLEELNEIVLGEYGKLEHVLDQLLASEHISTSTLARLGFVPSAKALEFGRQLDQITNRTIKPKPKQPK